MPVLFEAGRTLRGISRIVARERSSGRMRERTSERPRPIQSSPTPLINAVEDRLLQSKRPISAFFEVTARCNFGCKHCVVDERCSDMDTAQVMRILDMLKQLGCLYVLLSGGEPLMRSDIVEIIRAVKQRRMMPRVATNAYLIDAQVADRLAALGRTWFQVSLLGVTPEVYREITGVNDAFAKVVNAVRLLVERDMTVIAHAPLITLNFAQRHEIPRLAKSIGAVWWGFGPVIMPTVLGQTFPLQYRLTYDQFLTFYAETLTDGELQRWEVNPPEIYLKSQVCGAAKTVVGVTYRGFLVPCGAFHWELRETNLLDEGVDPLDVFANHPGFVRARNMRVRDMPGCESCKQYVPFCSRCQAALERTGWSEAVREQAYCEPARAIHKAYHQYHQ